MKRSGTRLFPVGLGVWSSTALTCAVLLVASAHMAGAAGVVGTGTAASCTDAAFNVALAGGGLVTFNCGPAAVAIDISTGTGTKTIAADTTIDGGTLSLITISGGNSVGVFYVNTGVNLTVQNLTIAMGYSAVLGGGISNGGLNGYGNIIAGGTVTVTNSTFSGNGAISSGGAIANVGTLTVTNSTFSSNNTADAGGAIASLGTLTVVNSTFSGNRAVYGGGIHTGTRGTATVTNSTFSGNSAGGSSDGDGGGIANGNGATVTVTNSTFSGNSVDPDAEGGGGIVNGGTLTVINSTFSGNSAPAGGGIGNSGTLTVTNTIVANSRSGGNCAGNAPTDGGHNIDDGTTCGFSTANGSLNNTTPKLDPAGLANNGGPTQTVALCTGTGAPSAGCTGASPAINAGDESVCSTTTGTAPVDNLDQRGFIRPGVGAANCSIGAFEANSEAPTSCVGDCNGNTQVAVNEIIVLVNIALGSAEPAACAAGIPSGSQVNVALIIQAVNNALNGCTGQ